MSFGYTQALWMKESATYGSAEDLATGTLYILPVKANVSLAQEIDVIETEHMRATASKQQAEIQTGKSSAGGAFSFVVPCKSAISTGANAFCVLVKHLLGKLATSGPAGTTYTHTFTWNDLLFPGLSIGGNRAGASYVYHGQQIKSLKLTCKVGGPLEATVTTVGKSEAAAAALTAPTVVLLSADPYWIFQDATFKMDTVATPITEIDLEFTNELEEADDKSFVLGSTTRALLPKAGHTVTGTVKRRHAVDGTNISKFYTKFLSGATAALVLTFTHPTDADYTMVITLGVTRFKGKTPMASDKGPIPEEIPFIAYDLDLSTSSIVATDKSPNPVSATGAYDGTSA